MVKHNKLILYTIGHSTRIFEEFLELLKAFKIKHLIDVRTIPKSRRMPWFADNALQKNLKENHIQYTHLKSLGGLRHAKKDSKNTGWRNASFRGYADYMETTEFRDALAELNNYLGENNVAIMCAEAVPWKCHRSLIADAELVQGIEVKHIISLTKPKSHQMTPFAKIISRDPLLIQYPDLLS